MAVSVAIREARVEDEGFILVLNAACTPAVGDMSAEQYRQLRGWAHRVLVAEVEGRAAGFLVLIRPGSAYPSDNYAWFEAKYSRHLYIDRIAIDASVRGAGAGRALYDAALRLAEDNGDERLTAEVNEDPPNPDSMKFHATLGFRHLLSRPTRAGKVVAMLERPLATA